MGSGIVVVVVVGAAVVVVVTVVAEATDVVDESGTRSSKARSWAASDPHPAANRASMASVVWSEAKERNTRSEPS